MDEPLVPLITYLKSNASVAALVADRVWGVEYLRSAIPQMPQKAIVVTNVGGRQLGMSARSWMRVGGLRVDVKSFGESPFEANKVDLAIWEALKALEKGDGIGWVEVEGGPFAMRDPDTDTAFTLSTYFLKVGEA